MDQVAVRYRPNNERAPRPDRTSPRSISHAQVRSRRWNAYGQSRCERSHAPVAVARHHGRDAQATRNSRNRAVPRAAITFRLRTTTIFRSSADCQAITRRRSVMGQSEPPSTRSSPLSRLFRIGKDSHGNWVVQDQKRPMRWPVCRPRRSPEIRHVRERESSAGRDHGARHSRARHERAALATVGDSATGDAGSGRTRRVAIVAPRSQSNVDLNGGSHGPDPTHPRRRANHRTDAELARCSKPASHRRGRIEQRPSTCSSCIAAATFASRRRRTAASRRSIRRGSRRLAAAFDQGARNHARLAGAFPGSDGRAGRLG